MPIYCEYVEAYVGKCFKGELYTSFPVACIGGVGYQHVTACDGYVARRACMNFNDGETISTGSLLSVSNDLQHWYNDKIYEGISNDGRFLVGVLGENPYSEKYRNSLKAYNYCKIVQRLA